MKPFQPIFLILALAASPPVSAETMSFENATAMLGASCGKDIDANCRGVNLDSARLKDCLARNRDSVSALCNADYVRAFDAIQKRIAARAAIPRMCDREALKMCGGSLKEDRKILQCLVTTPRGVSAKCNQAISEAGYRQ
jgi:hypothetical protein